MKKSKVGLFIQKIVANLSPEFLNSKYKKIKSKHLTDSPLGGHCYVATEALYYILSKPNEYQVFRSKIDDITHWWLEDKQHNILDVTSDQFTEKALETVYRKKQKAWFLTDKPSKRTRNLLTKMGYTDFTLYDNLKKCSATTPSVSVTILKQFLD